jgi:kynurenine formamidase
VGLAGRGARPCCNLEALADAKAYVARLILTPLRIQGATGSPLRAIALAP